MDNLKEAFSNKSNLLFLNGLYSRDVQIWEDESNNVLFVSPSSEKALGYSPNDFIANPNLFKKIIFSDDIKIWEERCKLISSEDIKKIQFRVLHKTGKTVWLEHSSQKILNSKGVLIGYYSSNRVVTNKKMSNQIIDKSSSMLFLWRNDEDFSVEFVSGNVERILGYSISDFLSGKISYNEIIHPECVDRVNQEINDNIKNRPKDFKHEPYRVITKNKNVIWVQDNTVVLEDEKGNITHFHGIVKDITNQYLTEIELRKSEQRLSYSLEAANIGSWELDTITNEFTYSNIVKELFGLNNGEYLGNYESFLENIHVEDRKKVQENTQNAIESSSSFEVEYRVIWPDGNIKWMLQQGKVFLDMDGNVTKMYGIIRDVSARISSNAFLVESEKRFKSFVENSPNGIVIHLEGRLLYANEMSKNLLKIPKTEKVIGTEIIKYIHPDEKETLLNRLKNVQEGIRKKPFFESRFICFDNTPIHVAVASSIVKYKDSKAIQTVFYNITSRKLAQDELRKSEERYRNVFSNSPLGILQFDKDGIITDCNEEFGTLIGTSREKLIGFNMPLSLIDNELREAIFNCLSKGSGNYENSYKSTISGKLTPVIARFNAIYSDTNEIIGGVGLVEDISERVKNEKLQKALFNISEIASKNISMKDLYLELHSVIKELMQANNFYIAMHHTEENIISFPFHVDEYDEHPEPKEFGNGLTEYILRTKKSQIITAERDKELQKIGEVELSGEFAQIWVGIYLKFEGAYRGVLVVQDYNNSDAYNDEDLKVLQFVSEQIIKTLDKKYADRRLRDSIKELSEAKKELEIINNNKDRFFSIIAHDLRAPFNTLLGVSEMISGDLKDMTMGEVSEISSVIHSSTQNLFKLIENLLNWSRIQMGSFQINPQILDIKNLTLDTIEILKYAAKEKNIEIVNEASEQSIYADEECFKTVLRNLINNAIKFTHRGGRVRVLTNKLQNQIQFTVEDNGVGMDKEVAKNLFNITSKTSTAGTENEKGTGLGLILCHDLVEKNNGTIWAESEYGKGSKFKFTLPIEKE